MCYKLGSFVLLQIGASVVTNWGSCYKLGQPLLKIGQLLQIELKFIQIGTGIKN